MHNNSLFDSSHSLILSSITLYFTAYHSLLFTITSSISFCVLGKVPFTRAAQSGTPARNFFRFASSPSCGYTQAMYEPVRSENLTWKKFAPSMKWTCVDVRTWGFQSSRLWDRFIAVVLNYKNLMVESCHWLNQTAFCVIDVVNNRLNATLSCTFLRKYAACVSVGQNTSYYEMAVDLFYLQTN